ncbi:SMC-Scp complex subunit ScpB [Limoniibacter endophyticus]|uniref:Segregation and condensation protein B n=1 Tax=Limoniibacter endophyticus TaxID=1565040 RepID=A0A8J3DFY0_9HYPH|nr:SMC-Scp complex subunit ScpB [Limoniibacter endophyticus]GHC62832.1 segregation and condensation protein B [Limoniibacter endophyticus]
MTDRENIVPFPREPDGLEAVSPAGDAMRARFFEAMRMGEALVFASASPVPAKVLAERLPDGTDVSAVMEELRRLYEKRGVNLVRVGDSWAFRTADDLAFLMSRDAQQLRKLSRAALEVLAIIAYHQPVTRAEIEEIRGVETSKGTLDTLLETEWVRMRGRRRTPGRPVTYGTTDAFLDHFQLEELRDLPGVDELKGAGLLSARMPSNFSMPLPPRDADVLDASEDPLEDIDLEELGLLPPKADED